MKTIINKSEVMKKAHELFNSENKFGLGVYVPELKWQRALKVAWCIVKFKARAVKRQVLIKYKKLDGTFRTAIATLCNDLTPKFTTTTTHRTKTNNDVQVYFDMTKQAWRSFRVENLITVI